MKVEILPVGDVPKELLSRLSSQLARFGIVGEVLMEVPVKRTDGKTSGPLHADALVRIAAERGPAVLAVTSEDLGEEGYEFVFGYANVGSSGAVVSIARMQDADEEQTLGRLVKEAMHELGHTWGLAHCDTLSCVMSHSAAMGDVDAKQERFCEDCRRRVPFGIGRA